MSPCSASAYRSCWSPERVENHIRKVCIPFQPIVFPPLRLSPPFLQQSQQLNIKKHGKSSQNLLRKNIFIHLFRWLPDLSETQCYSFNILLWRSRFSRQSIRRPSPIKDRYSLFHGSVPFHCHLSSVKRWAHFHRDGSLGA